MVKSGTGGKKGRVPNHTNSPRHIAVPNILIDPASPATPLATYSSNLQYGYQ